MQPVRDYISHTSYNGSVSGTQFTQFLLNELSLPPGSAFQYFSRNFTRSRTNCDGKITADRLTTERITRLRDLRRRIREWRRSLDKRIL